MATIKKNYPTAWVFRTAERWWSGVPDLIIGYKGRLIAIELKTKDGEVAKIQKYMIDKIQKAGCTATVCRSVKDVLAVMKPEQTDVILVNINQRNKLTTSNTT